MTEAQGMTVAELARLTGARVEGDAERRITAIAALDEAGETELSFCTGGKYRGLLETTGAGAVLVSDKDCDACPEHCVALVVDNPYYAFAAAAMALHPLPDIARGIHTSAEVAEDAELDADVAIGANAVVAAGARIGAGSQIGACTFIGPGVQIGGNCRIANNVSIGAGTRIADGVIVHPGALIGADGFGFAPGPEGWRKVPQIGGVRIEEGAEIGAGCTIDRGALKDTVIGRNVKLDDQVHVAHNVEIGEGTALAAGVMIAGSSRVGRRCMVGGVSGIADHVEIADDVILLGMTAVTGDIREAGVYGSPIPAQPVRQWRRNTVRITQLDDLFQRVKALEQNQDQSD